MHHSYRNNRITQLYSQNASFWLFSTHLKTRVVDLTAFHTLTQLYRNSSAEEAAECVYSFPIYESSGVSSFTATINDHTIVGKVEEKAAARKTYENAKALKKFTGLLEANRADVFTTSIGNVPGNSTVRIDIEYIHDLKQDLDVDGVKLVIPTVIAPRYGTPPEGLSREEVWHQYCQNRPEKDRSVVSEGFALEIDIIMSGDIRQVQSSSHPLAVHIGTHGGAPSNSVFDSKKAHAKLGTGAKSLDCLDSDFTLTVVATDLDKPRGFIAPHPTNPALSTMMLTLVPKFSLQQQRPEVVFVVDRSGSMVGKIPTVKAALHLFLASLPIGAHFNICSFGSNHSFLFSKSEPYTAESLARAKKHIETFDADFGGTEMYPPIKDTCARRLGDLNLEILFLTDGDVWNKERLLGLLSNKAKENVRLFSLGIGDTVTHSTIEALARAGKGYAQTVSESDNLDKKVIRMLKAALTPHVDDWEVTWDGKASLEEAFMKQLAPKEDLAMADSVTTLNETVNLYDESANADEPPPAAPIEETIPELHRPPVLQAPTEIPPLYPFTRFTLYYQLESPGPPPKEVTLMGTFTDKAKDSITPLALTIPLTTLPASLNLHIMFGRVHLQDLSEGHYPKHFSALIDPTTEPTKFRALVKREGTKAGLGFGLASKWTSFVAVDHDSVVKHPAKRPEDEHPTKKPEEKQKPMDVINLVSSAASEVSPALWQALWQTPSGRDKFCGPAGGSANSESQFYFEEEDDDDGEEGARFLCGAGDSADEEDDMGYGLFDDDNTNESAIVMDSHTPEAYVVPASRARQQEDSAAVDGDEDMGYGLFDGDYTKESAIVQDSQGYYQEEGYSCTAPALDTPEQIKATILSSQEFSGRFELTPKLLKALLGVDGEDKLKIDTAVAKEWVWATVLVYLFLDRTEEFREELEMVREKARAAVESEVQEGKVREVEKVVEGVLAENKD